MVLRASKGNLALSIASAHLFYLASSIKPFFQQHFQVQSGQRGGRENALALLISLAAAALQTPAIQSAAAGQRGGGRQGLNERVLARRQRQRHGARGALKWMYKSSYNAFTKEYYDWLVLNSTKYIS